MPIGTLMMRSTKTTIATIAIQSTRSCAPSLGSTSTSRPRSFCTPRQHWKKSDIAMKAKPKRSAHRNGASGNSRLSLRGASRLTSSTSSRLHHTFRSRPDRAHRVQEDIDDEVRAFPLRDAEVEKDRAQDEIGDRVLLPFIGDAEHVAPHDLEQREERAAQKQQRCGGREEPVLERPPERVR